MLAAQVLLTSLIALLKAQTDLITAVTAANPAVAAELWRRFADDTKWIHDALSKLNAHLEKIVGLDPIPTDPKAAA